MEWNERKPKMYWRGGAAGGMVLEGDNWKKIHRYRLLQYSMGKEDLFEFGVSNYPWCMEMNKCSDEKFIKIFGKKLGTPRTDPFETVYEYKYLMDVVSFTLVILVVN